MNIDSPFVNEAVVSGLARSSQITSLLTGRYLQIQASSLIGPTSKEAQSVFDYQSSVKEIKLLSESAQLTSEIDIRQDVGEKLATLKELAANPTERNKESFANILAELEPMTYYDVRFQEVGILEELGLSDISVSSPEDAKAAVEALTSAIEQNDESIADRSGDLETNLNKLEEQAVQSSKSINYDFQGLANTIQNFLSPGSLVNVLV
jgi:hypothetical protein